jgi:hypothetical protein
MDLAKMSNISEVAEAKTPTHTSKDILVGSTHIH